MGCHLCISFYYKETLGYTALMGVPPRVQPMFTLQQENTGLHCSHAALLINCLQESVGLTVDLLQATEYRN